MTIAEAPPRERYRVFEVCGICDCESDQRRVKTCRFFVPLENSPGVDLMPRACGSCRQKIATGIEAILSVPWIEADRTTAKGKGK